jgi:hypothetical protein
VFSYLFFSSLLLLLLLLLLVPKLGEHTVVFPKGYNGVGRCLFVIVCDRE